MVKVKAKQMRAAMSEVVLSVGLVVFAAREH